MAATQKNAYSQHKYPVLAVQINCVTKHKNGNESCLRMNKLYSICAPPDPLLYDFGKPLNFFLRMPLSPVISYERINYWGKQRDACVLGESLVSTAMQLVA